ncbi:hypothetical protein BT96DRAFT_929450, partial [Gymnopus androsaceus JB14]
MLYKYRSLSTLIALSLSVKVSFSQSITVNCLSAGQEGDCTSFIPAFCNSISSSGNATVISPLGTISQVPMVMYQVVSIARRSLSSFPSFVPRVAMVRLRVETFCSPLIQTRENAPKTRQMEIPA